MRWVVWLLLGCIGFLVAAWLFPRSPAQPAGASVATLPADGTAPSFAQRSASGLSGRAQVIDGDSLRVGATEVRLYGIDAPEGVQTCVSPTGAAWPCGERASQALRGLVQGHHVVCDERDVDAYGRVVAVCRRGDTNVNAWLVENGWALAYRRHSLSYIVQESAAETERRGIWNGRFEAPWDWRAKGRQRSAGSGPASNPDSDPGVQLTRPDGASDRQTARCNIKGNVSQSSGTRFYHMPGDRDYQRTRISTARGEWWFCSEAAAQAAGWRRAGPAVASDRQRAGCNIKGNVSHNGGKRLYHMPGDPDYHRTQISAGRGERWFCSESEARAAGWQRAGT